MKTHKQQTFTLSYNKLKSLFEVKRDDFLIDTFMSEEDARIALLTHALSLDDLLLPLKVQLNGFTKQQNKL